MARELMRTDDGDDLVAGPAPLSPKEELFCRAWGDPQSETFGRATKSAAVAGYTQPHNAAWKLRRRPRIIARLKEYEEMAAADLGRVMATIEHIRLAAEEKGDHATALRAAELQGRRLGAFFERSVLTLDVPAQHEYDAVLAVEASRIARLLIEEAGAAGLGAAPPETERKQLNPGQKEAGT